MLEPVINILQAELKDNGENASLKRTLSHLTRLNEDPTASRRELTWDVIFQDFKDLTTQGLWESSQQNDGLLKDIKRLLNMSVDGNSLQNDKMEEKQQRISIVAPPPISAPLLPQDPSHITILPAELLDTLNHTYFMHLLAIDPSKVLPPGKSLLSVMSHAHAQQRPEGELPSLKDRVETIVHKAFWDEVCYSRLSSL